MVVRIIDQFHVKDQQRTVTGVAVTVGVATAVGFAPFGTIAAELAPLSRLIPAAYPAWVEGLAAVETVLGLLYTVSLMWESGGY